MTGYCLLFKILSCVLEPVLKGGNRIQIECISILHKISDEARFNHLLSDRILLSIISKH